MPSSETKTTDVVVIGGGPAGSTTATLLARHGFRVVLVDRAHFPRPKTCAEYLSPGVLDVLDRTGMSEALKSGQLHTVPGMDVISPAGHRMRLHYSIANTSRNAATLPRTALDAALVAQARLEHVDLVEGFVARRPLFDADRVAGVEGIVAGNHVEIRARLTVVADGARSSLARGLGLARPARWPVRLGLVAHFQGPVRLDEGFGQMHVGQEGYCGLAPLSHDRVNVAMVVPADVLKRTRRSATSYFDTWIASHDRVQRLLKDARRITPVRGLTPVGSRSAQAWVPGALLVGDAAGFFDPFTGEGIYRAVAGARLASEVAAQAFEAGDFSAKSLAPYGERRRLLFRRKEGVTALVQLFVQQPALLEYALPRLQRRTAAGNRLANVLGDITDARTFLNPPTLFAALCP